MASLSKDEDLCSFDVPETKRESNGPTLYKIVLQVIPKDITKNAYQLVCWKRYTDIRKLYDVLHRYHLAVFRPGKFPDFPEKSRFMERFNATIVEERRVATKHFLNFVLEHLYLRTHDAYLQFLQPNERVESADVPVVPLQPECLDRPPSPKIVVEEEKAPTSSTDLLLTLDDENRIEQVTDRSAQILEELQDLQFEQQEKIEEEKEEFDLVNDQINEAANLLSLPFPSKSSS